MDRVKSVKDIIAIKEEGLALLQDLRPYADVYVSQLCKRDLKAFEYILSEYEFECEDDTNNNLRSGQIFRDYAASECKDLDLFMRAYFSSVTIKAGSSYQRKAFELFSGPEFKIHFLKFLNQSELEYDRKVKRISPDYTITRTFGTLIRCEEWDLNYATALLTNDFIEPVNKEVLIEAWGTFRQHEAGKFLSEKEVNLVLQTSREYSFSAQPIIPSIKAVYDLKDVPDHWIKETYLKGYIVDSYLK